MTYRFGSSVIIYTPWHSLNAGSERNPLVNSFIFSRILPISTRKILANHSLGMSGSQPSKKPRSCQWFFNLRERGYALWKLSANCAECEYRWHHWIFGMHPELISRLLLFSLLAPSRLHGSELELGRNQILQVKNDHRVPGDEVNESVSFQDKPWTHIVYLSQSPRRSIWSFLSRESRAET